MRARAPRSRSTPCTPRSAMRPSARSHSPADARSPGRRDVGRRGLGRRAAARARRRRRRGRPHAAALDRRAGARRRARLLLARGGAARARELPRARPAARHARWARGLPRGGRRAVRGRLRARRDAEPVHDLQRLVPPRSARRRRRPARCRARGDGPLRASRRARRPRRSWPAGPTTPRISRTCSRASRRRCSRGLRLPLGDATKAAVRAEAAAAGMAAATARESQDVCFLGGGALDGFLAREGVQLAAGSIRDEAGRELGRHDGAVAYTPGQRRGLGLSAPEPLYVLRADADAQRARRGPAQQPRPQRGAPARDAPRRGQLAGCTPSCAPARPRSRRASSRPPTACGSCSTSRSSGWPQGRPRCSTTIAVV